MTITSSTAKTGPYAADGSTVDFDYDFLIFADEDIVVTVTTDDVDAVKTLTTDYTVSGAGNTGGGTVTFGTAPADGAFVTLTRSTQVIQDVDLQNRGAVVPETLEQALDRLTMILQDLKEKVSRAALAGVTESSPVSYADIVAASTAATAAQTAAEAAQAAAEAAENSLLEWKGAWVTATAYAPSDVVSNSGSSYVCVEAHTSGTFSTDLSAGKWQVAAAKGDTGAGTGDLLAANDLSDLNDADTALVNLGGGTTGIALFKDTTAAAARTELGLGGLATLDILDEDDMATDSATRPPSQQSVAAYIRGWVPRSVEIQSISGSPTEIIFDDTNGLFTDSNASGTEPNALTFNFRNVLPAVDNVELLCRVSTDGGSTWLSGATDYINISGSTLTGFSAITLCNTIGNAAGEGVHRGAFYWYPPHSADTNLIWSSSFLRVSPDGVTYNFFNNRGTIANGANINAVRFYLSSGAFSSGYVYVDRTLQQPALF